MVVTVFSPGVRVHVVGVGGAGMSGLARLLVESGAVVSGSDLKDSVTLEALRELGVTVFVGHDGANVRADVVSWSPAVRDDNVELVAARDAGATMLSRAQVLAELARARPLVGLTGTHGKTTATSMLVQVMAAEGRDVGRLLGADVLGVGANGHWGSGDVVVEVDESYGTFSLVRPHALGLLNVEADHLDHYGTLGALEHAFAQLLDRTDGPVVIWNDDAGCRRVASIAAREVVRVGSARGERWRVSDVAVTRESANFTLTGPDVEQALTLHVTGLHNVADAAVVAVLATQLGVSVASIRAGLENFVGAPRRFELLGSWRGVDVYESYAHLPGEIRAILRATRAAGYERITAVFQPHRVTRTLSLVDDFAPAFDVATAVVVTDIYTAGEPNPTGVTGEVIAAAILRRGAGVATTYCAALEDVPDVLEALHDRSDVVVLLGAGDVASVATRLRGMD
ncbi:MAG: UDP-N-acetylmuramate--L-alanine ligase [Acidimicrobiales bacterium]|jgi:UDP-N-acetylmuramate--alanine ligase